MNFKSMTYGQLDLKEIPNKLLHFYDERKVFGTPFHLIIGTDSQTKKETKIVTVIAIVCEGHGGIFFYTSKTVPMITNLARKLETETGDSLLVATELLEELESDNFSEFMKNVPITIHIDAGNTPRNKTKSLIDGLIGWVTATGLQCEIKPDSFVASTIADRISK